MPAAVSKAKLTMCGHLRTNLSFSSSMLLLTASSPSARSLGSLNGLAQMVASLSRALGPFLASALFAWSVQHPDILGGRVVWNVFTIVSLISWASTAWLQEGRGWEADLQQHI